MIDEENRMIAALFGFGVMGLTQRFRTLISGTLNEMRDYTEDPIR